MKLLHGLEATSFPLFSSWCYLENIWQKTFHPPRYPQWHNGPHFRHKNLVQDTRRKRRQNINKIITSHLDVILFLVHRRHHQENEKEEEGPSSHFSSIMNWNHPSYYYNYWLSFDTNTPPATSSPFSMKCKCDCPPRDDDEVDTPTHRSQQLDDWILL